MNRTTPNNHSKYGHIDIHCHKPNDGNNLAIVSLDTSNFTADTAPSCSFSLGIHPWFISQQDWRSGLQSLSTIRADPNLLAIGECGLDKNIDAPMHLQIEIFTRQIELAQRIDKPLIIHCVRAFNELMVIKKQTRCNLPWIIHGFIGNPVMTLQLIKQGFYLSFGKALLRNNCLARQSLATSPLDRIFLETDAADDVTISEIYSAAAKILVLDTPTLQRQIVANFNRVFTHD